MPNYFYTAKTIDGKTKEGTLFADDVRQLAKKLREENLILTKVVSEEEKNAQRNKVLRLLFNRKKVSSTEKILMTRNLYIMTATGLSMVKIFDILENQTKNKKLRKVFLDIKGKIQKGSSLSEALSFYPDIFSELYISMVKVGEEGGTLEEVFRELAVQLEKEHELKSKVQGALIYPAIILATMFLVGIVVITFVLPQLNTFFSTLNVELPFYTKIVLALGNFARKNLLFLIISLFLLIFAIVTAIRTKQGKKIIDTFLLKLPFLSLLIKENNCAIFIRAFSSLLSSGVPLLRSLEVSSNLLGNYHFKKAIEEAQAKVKKGESLSSALKPYREIFPFGLIEMVEVGEETGKSSLILKQLAEFYEQEVIRATTKLSTAIEPILIVILAIGVGVFAISVIEPMYSILKTIE